MKIVHCKQCGTRLSNNEIALNIKIFGKQVGVIKCYDCLADLLDCNSGKLRNMALYYKNTGCSVFQTKYTEEGVSNE